MRIFNWILKTFSFIKKALNFIKDSAELIKWIIIAVLVISTFTGFKSCKKERQNKNDVVKILTSKIETFKTKSGLNAVETKNWQIKYKALDNLNSEISQNNNVYLNELLEAKQTIKDLKIREKDVKNYIKTELVSRDSLETSIIWLDNPCRFKLEPIEQEFLSLRFEQNDNYDLLGIDYESRNTIHTLINLYPSKIDNLKRKRHGKKHFPNWAIFWGWDHTTISKVKNPKSKITNIVSIEFE